MPSVSSTRSSRIGLSSAETHMLSPNSHTVFLRHYRDGISTLLSKQKPVQLKRLESVQNVSNSTMVGMINSGTTAVSLSFNGNGHTEEEKTHRRPRKAKKVVKISDGPPQLISHEGGTENSELLNVPRAVLVTVHKAVYHNLSNDGSNPKTVDCQLSNGVNVLERDYENEVEEEEDAEYSCDEVEGPWAGREGKRRWTLQTLLNTEHNAISKNLNPQRNSKSSQPNSFDISQISNPKDCDKLAGSYVPATLTNKPALKLHNSTNGSNSGNPKIINILNLTEGYHDNEKQNFGAGNEKIDNSAAIPRVNNQKRNDVVVFADDTKDAKDTKNTENIKNIGGKEEPSTQNLTKIVANNSTSAHFIPITTTTHTATDMTSTPSQSKIMPIEGPLSSKIHDPKSSKALNGTFLELKELQSQRVGNNLTYKISEAEEEGQGSDLGSISDFLLSDSGGLLDEISSYFDSVKPVQARNPTSVRNEPNTTNNQNFPGKCDNIDKLDAFPRSNELLDVVNRVAPSEHLKREELISPLYEELDYAGLSISPTKNKFPATKNFHNFSQANIQASNFAPTPTCDAVKQDIYCQEVVTPCPSDKSTSQSFFNSIGKFNHRRNVVSKMFFGSNNGNVVKNTMAKQIVNSHNNVVKGIDESVSTYEAMPTDKTSDNLDLNNGTNRIQGNPQNCLSANNGQHRKSATREIKKEDIVVLFENPTKEIVEPGENSANPLQEVEEKNSVKSPPSETMVPPNTSKEVFASLERETESTKSPWLKTFFNASSSSNLAARILQFDSMITLPTSTKDTNHGSPDTTTLGSSNNSIVDDSSSLHFPKFGKMRFPTLPFGSGSHAARTGKISKTPSFNLMSHATEGSNSSSNDSSFEPTRAGLFNKSKQASPSLSDVNHYYIGLGGSSSSPNAIFLPRHSGPLSKSNRSRSLDKTSFNIDSAFMASPLTCISKTPKNPGKDKDLKDQEGGLDIGSFAFDLSKYTMQMTQKINEITTNNTLDCTTEQISSSVSDVSRNNGDNNIHPKINNPTDMNSNKPLLKYVKEDEKHTTNYPHSSSSSNGTLKFSTIKRIFAQKTQQGISSIMGGLSSSSSNGNHPNHQRSSLINLKVSQLFTSSPHEPPDTIDSSHDLETVTKQTEGSIDAKGLTESQMMAINSILDSFSSSGGEENWSAASSVSANAQSVVLVSVPTDQGSLNSNLQPDLGSKDKDKDTKSPRINNLAKCKGEKTLTKNVSLPFLQYPNHDLGSIARKPLPPIPVNSGLFKSQITTFAIASTVTSSCHSFSDNAGNCLPSSSSEFSGEGVIVGPGRPCKKFSPAHASRGLGGARAINKPKVPPPKPPATMPRKIMPQDNNKQVIPTRKETIPPLNKPKLPNKPPKLINNLGSIKQNHLSPTKQMNSIAREKVTSPPLTKLNSTISALNKVIEEARTTLTPSQLSSPELVPKVSSAKFQVESQIKQSSLCQELLPPRRKPPPPPPIMKARMDNHTDPNIPVIDLNEYYDPISMPNTNESDVSTTTNRNFDDNKLLQNSKKMFNQVSMEDNNGLKILNNSFNNETAFYEEYLTPNVAPSSTNAINGIFVTDLPVDNQSIPPTKKVLQLLESKIGKKSNSLPPLKSRAPIQQLASIINNKHSNGQTEQILNHLLSATKINVGTKKLSLPLLKEQPHEQTAKFRENKCTNYHSPTVILDDQRKLITSGLKPSEIKKNQKLKTNSSFKL